KENWINLLHSLAGFWREKPAEAEEYASRLTEGIRQAELIQEAGTPREFTEEDLEAIVTPWKRTFDMAEGGFNRAPKFPMPNNWLFLMRYAYLFQDNAVHIALRL